MASTKLTMATYHQCRYANLTLDHMNEKKPFLKQIKKFCQFRAYWLLYSKECWVPKIQIKWTLWPNKLVNSLISLSIFWMHWKRHSHIDHWPLDQLVKKIVSATWALLQLPCLKVMWKQLAIHRKNVCKNTYAKQIQNVTMTLAEIASSVKWEGKLFLLSFIDARRKRIEKDSCFCVCVLNQFPNPIIWICFFSQLCH